MRVKHRMAPAKRVAYTYLLLMLHDLTGAALRMGVKKATITNWRDSRTHCDERLEGKFVRVIMARAQRMTKGDLLERTVANIALRELRRLCPSAFAPKYSYEFVRHAVTEYLREVEQASTAQIEDHTGIERRAFYNAMANCNWIERSGHRWYLRGDAKFSEEYV